MFTEEKSRTHLEQFHQLWQALTFDLTGLPGVFDAHGVCAAVAQQVAIHTATKTIVGISGLDDTYYDVWIGDENGRLDQQRWKTGRASFRPVIHSQTAVHLDKFSQPPADLLNSELWRIPRESLRAVRFPYPSSESAISPSGVICLVDPTEECCLDLDTLELLASNVTVYLDRASLRLQVDRQHIEFQVVSDLSFNLASTLSLRSIYSQLMNPIKRTLNVESLSVGLIDEPNDEIQFVNLLMGPLFEDLPQIRIKKGQGIAGWVAEKRQPVIINDTYSDTRFYANVDRTSGFHTRSMICIPLQVEERIIGVLQAINKQNGEFHDNDLRLLLAIGGPLAAAIENANLHGEVTAEKLRIETIFKSMSEGMITLNLDGSVTNVNDALLSLLRLPLETNLSGRKANDLIHLKKGTLDEFVEQILSEEEEYPSQANDLRSGHTTLVPVLMSGAPILDDKGNVNEVIVVFSDLSEIREFERLRDDFFHNIIHELRTPLATILMYARMLRSGKATTESKKERFLGVIERESDRLQKMVRQMLELAKMEAREFQRSAEPVNLKAVFDEMLPPLADLATQKGLIFRQRMPNAFPNVMGTQEVLYLVFKNLIDNAIKFTPEGEIMVDVRVDNGQVVVRVKDDGIGIPKQALPNLFKRFYRTQTAVEKGIAGTGLGLSMVKESIEHYNGTISVESGDGNGTTFIVELPIAK